ncbi:hypothetical protein V3C99_012454 [Haemonchus contortus]
MNCSDIAELVEDTRFRALVGTQASAAFLSLFISSAVLRRCGSLYFHVNCKILIATMLTIFVVHSILLAGILGTHLYRYLTISDPCEVLVQSPVCFSIRYPTTVCTTSMILLEFSMVVERAIALRKRSQYDSFGPKIGISLSAVSVLLAMLSCAWAMSEEDFSKSYAYCSPVTPKTSKNMMVLVFASSGVSGLTISGIVILFIFNRYAKKRKCFDLITSYQLRENDSVLRLLLPLDIFQATVSGFATTGGFIIMIFKDQLTAVSFRIFLTSMNLFPYYTIVSPILLWFIIRWSRRLNAEKRVTMVKKKNENENEIYFRTYNEMWGHQR